MSNLHIVRDEPEEERVALGATNNELKQVEGGYEGSTIIRTPIGWVELVVDFMKRDNKALHMLYLNTGMIKRQTSFYDAFFYIRNSSKSRRLGLDGDLVIDFLDFDDTALSEYSSVEDCKEQMMRIDDLFSSLEIEYGEFFLDQVCGDKWQEYITPYKK